MVEAVFIWAIKPLAIKALQADLIAGLYMSVYTVNVIGPILVLNKECLSNL